MTYLSITPLTAAAVHLTAVIYAALKADTLQRVEGAELTADLSGKVFALAAVTLAIWTLL